MKFKISILLGLLFFFLIAELSAQEIKLNFLPSNGERGEYQSVNINDLLEQSYSSGTVTKEDYEKIKNKIVTIKSDLEKRTLKHSSNRAPASISSNSKPHINTGLLETVNEHELNDIQNFMNDVETVLKD